MYFPSIQTFFRIFIILVCFSFIFYLDDARRNDIPFSISRFLIGVYQNELNYSYWYIYAYLLYLLLLPFNQIINRYLKNNPKYVSYLFGITIFYMAFLPYFELVMGNRYKLYSSLIIPDTIIYVSAIPLIGSWFYNSSNIEKINFRICYSLSVLGLFLSAAVTWFWQGSDVKTPQNYFMSMTLISSLTILLTVRKIASHKFSKGFSNMIHFVGRATFGIYLIHVFFVTNYQWDDIIYFWLVDHHIPHIISGGVSACIIMIVCTIIVMPIQYFFDNLHLRKIIS